MPIQKLVSGHINSIQDYGCLCLPFPVTSMAINRSNFTCNKNPYKKPRKPYNGVLRYTTQEWNWLLQKVSKCHEESEYAIVFENGFKNKDLRFHEHRGFVRCLQCSRRLENEWFWLVLLLRIARKRLWCLLGPESASKLDFSFTLFTNFFKFCLVCSCSL